MFSIGDTILRDNEISIVYVVKNEDKLYKLSKDGRKQIVGFLYPGDFLGMSDQEVYTYNAEALEDTQLCQFNKIVLENFFLKFPLRIFPDGNFNFCEFTFFPFTITS